MLTVCYRNDKLIAVVKPAGMLVHRGWGQDAVTVADLVRDHIVKSPVHAVHRLDRGTSGVVLFALDAEAARQVQKQFEAGNVVKRYLTLVRGPMTESCILDHPIPQRDSPDRVAAITQFEPLAHSGRWSLVEARPLTGRTHQIRLHLKHLSHPIVGDVRYGKGDVNRHFREQFDFHRLALHAFGLDLDDSSGRRAQIRAGLTEDFAQLLSRLDLLSAVRF